MITGGNFQDRKLPAGYAPFNVAVLGGKVYVAYAKQDADREDEVAGPGMGRVDVFSLDGAPARGRLATAALNAPWGLAIAPAGFGTFSGDLLVGNFGDGRIHAFDPEHPRPRPACCAASTAGRSGSTASGRCSPATARRAAPTRCCSPQGRRTRPTGCWARCRSATDGGMTRTSPGARRGPRASCVVSCTRSSVGLSRLR